MAELISIPPNLLVLLHLTYLLKPFARPLKNSLHPTRFGASFSAEFQLCPCSFSSDSLSLRQVFLSRPLLLLPCGFHLRSCLVMLFGGFLSVWPIHVHFLFLICVFMLVLSFFLDKLRGISPINFLICMYNISNH